MSSSDAKMPASKMPAVNAVSTTDTSIKRESVASPMSMTNGTTKLSSLTPARDLTLGGRGGGASAAKKVFLPNLNVVRNKNA